MIIFHLASIHLFGFWIHNLIGGSITSGDCSGPLPQLLQVDCISSSTLMGKARSEGYRQAEHCVVLLGEGGVGKTALTLQFVHARFVSEYDPSLEDTYKKQCVIDGENAAIEVLDTAGQDDYSTFRERYLGKGDVFLLVFAINSRSSFEKLRSLQQQILRVKNEECFPMLLVGNKTDLESERQISATEAKQMAAAMNCRYIETSAKLRHNIEEIFFGAVRESRKYRHASIGIREDGAGGDHSPKCQLQ